VDLHSFEPAPAIAAAIAQADVVLVNGHNLEEVLLEVIEQSVSTGVRIVAVSDGIERLLTGGDGEPGEDAVDPHLWLDVRNAIHCVEQIRNALIEVDPARESGYEERAAAYIEQLDALDVELVLQMADLPDEARRLVVFHDAYGYFAAAYRLEVLAAVLPAGAQQDPAAGTVAELIGLLRESGVSTIFAEPQFNSVVLESIAEEADVDVGVLYSTFAGEVDSYVELMRANADALRDSVRR
jgi:ABC-type Zn uptake system ZnuABC Zn-binding protein ZnuA